MSRTLTLYFGEPATQTLQLKLATDDWAEATESALRLGCVLWGNAEEVKIVGRESPTIAEKCTSIYE
jgi:hypothetical protein